MEPNGSAKSRPKNGTKSDQSDQKSRILPPFRLTGQCECAVAYPQPTLGQIKNLSPIFGQLPSAAGGVRVIMGEGGEGGRSVATTPPPPHSAGGEAGVSRCTRLGQPHKCNQIKLQSQNSRPTNQSFLCAFMVIKILVQ